MSDIHSTDSPTPESRQAFEQEAEFLAVDLDGTLIHSDLLVESVFILIKRQPWMLFHLVLWLFQGRAILKTRIAERVNVPIKLLPYNKGLLSYLHDEKSRGRRLILATASHTKYAQAIAEELGLFEAVIATNAQQNTKGDQKARTLIEYCQRNARGAGGFDYAGDATADLKIWSHARKAIVVGTNTKLRERAAQVAELGMDFTRKRGLKAEFATLLRQLRLHQWSKNALVFLPAVTAHQLSSMEIMGQMLLAFFAFGFCASSIYILNDLLDLESDRLHRTKRNRPLASGDLSLLKGLMIMPLLLIMAFALALWTGPDFTVLLLAYLLLTTAYSVHLKSMVLLDVISLAALYTLRLIGGGVAADIELSFWILSFSMFMFFSLALVKRVSELLELKQDGGEWIRGRGYHTKDLDTLHTLGISSGYAAIFVIALYINSAEIVALYDSPKMIWLLCPILLYWVSRIWIIVHRGQLHSDPVVFALRDRVSYIALILSASILYAAR